MNTAVGFVVSMAIYRFVIDPIYGLNTSTSDDFGIVGLFTLASIVRQYVLRRVLDGRSIYSWAKEVLA